MDPTTGDAGLLRIRFGTPADYGLLAEIGAETFADTFASDNTPADMAAYLAGAFGPEQQARELADPATTFLIAELAGTVVGYACIGLGPAPAPVRGQQPAEIRRIYVRKPWVGSGVGARLMQACLAEASRGGCDVVWLGVWERNPRAIAFYQKWGFQQVGTQHFQLGADRQTDWVMALRTHPSA
jgi:GNAT superfamily N-acetyltransferase